MPAYRIHRIKPIPRENFRWAPHTGGEAVVKSKDYEPDGTVEAPTPYVVWKQLVEQGQPFAPGDVLEVLPNFVAAVSDPEGDSSHAANPLLIAKYIGFEPARWFVPELRRVEDQSSMPSLSSDGTSSESASVEHA